MRFLAATLVSLFLGFAPSAHAEVQAASPSGFIVHAEAELEATPAQVWRALPRIERWWSSEHTFSGDSRRLSLDPRAGRMLVRALGQRAQSVEHGRVVLVMEHEGVRTLRVLGALGPLQEMGVNGVLTFTVEPHASGAKIAMTYRASGDVGLGLDEAAPLVNSVLMEQFGRLSRYSASGSPD